MTDQFRALCAELVEKVGLITWGSGTPEDLKELLNRIRAALAKPVGEWASMPAAINSMPEAQRRWYVLGWRAAIARWGRPAAAPVPEPGEVAELVAWLRGTRAARLTRAAELLSQRHPTPVPVSERLPGPEDCDVEGRCWWGEPQIEDSHDATWNLCTQDDAEEFCIWGTKCGWLPFHALPLLEQEVNK